MSAVTPLIPARQKDVNRAKVCDDNFIEFVRGWNGTAAHKPAPDAADPSRQRCARRGISPNCSSRS